MDFRTLGDSDLQISEIGLGSWLTYAGGVERETARACTHAAFDAGITFFDTANVYGLGAAEEVWGEILPEFPRDSYVLATKLYSPMGEGHAGGLSAREIHTQLDASLRRLRTDYVDLYQCHRYDPDTPIEETLEALTEVVRAGKVRYIGFSEWMTDQIEAALDVPGVVRFVSSQPQYNMVWRGPEAEIFPLCAANGISHVVWSPMAQGVLTGKYLPGQAPPADSRAAHAEMGQWTGQWLRDELLEAVQRLRPIADQAGLTMAQLAVAWVLHREEVASAIIGASRPEQVHEAAGASGVRLGDDVLAAIDAALGDEIIREWRLPYRARPGVLRRADVA